MLLNIFNQINDAIIIFEPEQETILEVNDKAGEVYGYSREEIIGVSFKELSKDIDSGSENISKVLKTGNVNNFETVHISKSGKPIYVLANASLINYEGQEAILSINRDTTQLIKSQAALKESEEKFRTLFENTTVGIYRTSPDGKILFANKIFFEMFGYGSLEEFQSVNARDTYVDPKRRDDFKRLLKEQGLVIGYHNIGKTKDEKIIHIRESVKAVKDELGNIKCYDGVVEDITDLQNTMDELVEAKTKAEKSDRLKTEFLAQISHEIRTPLSSLLNSASLLYQLNKDAIDTNQAEIYDIIKSSSKRIIRTIELIIQMSEIQTGSYDYSPKTFDLIREILKPIYNEFSIQPEAKKLQLSSNYEHSSIMIKADKNSINQVFVNLIENALKYTEHGFVKIDARKNDTTAFVSVIDSGVGIKEEYIPNLFKPFSQEEGGYSRRYEGNGLGLALVKKYCDLNNATIDVKSKKGEGTEFVVKIPLC